MTSSTMYRTIWDSDERHYLGNELGDNFHYLDFKSQGYTQLQT